MGIIAAETGAVGGPRGVSRTAGVSAFVLFALVLGAAGVEAEEFADYWYDNRAEISTYRLVEQRYGEPREGTRVMVFVTEAMRLSTLIKPDVDLPAKDKVEVIKLNDLRKFTTGIYDYSVMTSVFASVETRRDIPLLGTMKVAFSAQEWCGTVAERMVRRGGRYEGLLYSYFESDGEASYRIAHGNTVETEDNLWILVRELKGPILRTGETRSMSIIASAWSRRKAHRQPEVLQAVLSKGAAQRMVTAVGAVDAVPFSWRTQAGTTTVWVEAAHPRRILAWTEADGSRGEIIASVRETYWQQNASRYRDLRGALGLRD